MSRRARPGTVRVHAHHRFGPRLWLRARNAAVGPLRWGVVAASVGLLSAVAGATPTPKEIVEKAEQTRKIDNSIQTVRMTLVSKSGAERTREMELKVRRDADAVRSYTRFLAPADVAGTAMVIVDHPDTVDEQLLYVPALRRVTRISGKGRSGAFLGSDFLFEDLEVSNADAAKHTLLAETAEEWTIETIPGADSTYGRLVVHVRKSDYLPTLVEFFDKHNVALKTLRVTETLTAGDATYPKVSEMVNTQKGTRTRLEVLEYKVNLPAEQLPDDLFSQTNLERGG